MRTDRSNAHVRRTAARGLARIAALAAVACACGAPFIPAVNAGSTQTGPALGLWYDDTGDGAVEVRPCGDKLCGYIVWLKEPFSTKQVSPRSTLTIPSPPSERGRFVVSQVLGNLERQSDGGWDNGWVYDPKEGKSYDAAVALEGRSKLLMTGYKGIKLLSKTLTWTRAPAELPRCQNGV